MFPHITYLLCFSILLLIAQRNISQEIESDISTSSNDDPDEMFQVLDILVSGSSFYGEWTSLEGQNPPQFENSQGFVRMTFSKDNWAGENASFHEKLALYFYDGQYTDQNLIKLTFPEEASPIVNTENSTLTFKNLSLTVHKKVSDPIKCSLNASLYFLNLETGKPFDPSSPPDADGLGIQIVFNSPNCSMSLSTNPSTQKDPIFFSQLIPYVVVMYLLVVLSGCSYLALFAKLRSKPQILLDLSLGTLYFFATFDIFIFFDHIYTSSNFATPNTRPLLQGIGIFYAAIFMFCNLPCLLEIKFRLSRIRWKEASEKIFFITNIGKGAILNFMAFIFAFETVIVQQRAIFYVMFAFFLLPQIVQNFVIGKKFRWNFIYMGLLFIPKIIYFIYSQGYVFNIFRNTPNPSFCICILVIILMQVIILGFQTKSPRFCLKQRHAYLVSDRPQGSSPTCPICLQDFDDHEGKKALKKSLLEEETTIIKTPCQHEFHLTCLKSWLGQKFECPYCRKSLPLSHYFEGQEGIFRV